MKIVKRFYIFVFLIAIFLRASFPVFGDENTQNFQQLIDDYVQAVHSNDAQQIKTTWSALNQDEAAKAYMRENMPGVEYLFNIRGLYFELQDYQSSRPEYFGKKPTDSDFQGTLD
ncbi:MAG: hypothetical protein JNN05_11610, partial [Candidatus Omnitrophica bacterium]|nr:hypothetical protein [Candidatus Omnitrophota bacterium]